MTVTAPPSLRSLYAEVVAAQQAAFDMFNAVNDDNDFDIICRRERPPKDARATYDEQRSDSIANSPINTFFRGLFGNADEGE